MMRGALRKYYIGLGVLVLFAFVMLVVVVVQGASAKQDNETARRASEIATKLNDYTDTKQQVPASLDAIKVDDVPSTITYTKLSASSYKFCATYKSTSDDFTLSDAASTLTGQSLAQMDPGNSSDTSMYSPDTSYYLYTDGPHKKGENCQTIQLYSDNLLNGNNGSASPACSYDYSLPSDQADQAYMDCLDGTTGTNDSNSSI